MVTKAWKITQHAKSLKGPFFVYKMFELLGQRGQLTQETELLDSLIEKVQNQVAHSSKTDLINRSEELLLIFKQVG